MIVRRMSILTMKIHEREIDITEEQLEAWRRGACIQDVVPHLSADDREFIISGITPEEWASLSEED